jgi:hypothetical protein
MSRGMGNYVCTICSRTFTRKPSGERHRKNNNLRSAEIVQSIDYIIGRLEGWYPPGDLSLHRRRKNEKKNQRSSSFTIDNYKNANSQFTTLPDMTTEESSQYVWRGDRRVNNDAATNKGPSENEPTLDRIRSDIENKFRSSRREGANVYQRHSSTSQGISSSELLEETLKLQQFSVLVRRHYSKDNAKAILADAIMYLAGSNWDDWMDSKLAFLRSIDKVL